MTPSELQRAGDDELVAATAAGDAAAFATLFRRRSGDVYRFAMHMTGSSAAADDITQDVFLVVMQEASRYDTGRSTVAAWLCGIARNHARRSSQRERVLMPLAREPDAEPQIPPVDADPIAELARAERVAAVRRAVLRLPVKYREVIVLCDLQEMNYADAAAAVGCAVGTVRSRLHRARVLLARKLAAEEGRPAALKQGSGCFA